MRAALYSTSLLSPPFHACDYPRVRPSIRHACSHCPSVHVTGSSRRVWSGLLWMLPQSYSSGMAVVVCTAVSACAKTRVQPPCEHAGRKQTFPQHKSGADPVNKRCVKSPKTNNRVLGIPSVLAGYTRTTCRSISLLVVVVRDRYTCIF